MKKINQEQSSPRLVTDAELDHVVGGLSTYHHGTVDQAQVNSNADTGFRGTHRAATN